ncbi:hypothetical protein [Streptomyces sp. NPDC090445]|uniref:hypothetical protein n=1 Tax=Streptomyces sp. NPDC090445 TaxID=3365963 RepID=UPI003809D122
MNGTKSRTAARAAMVGLAAALLAGTQTGAASAEPWVADKVRIRAGNDLNECLTAFERSTDPLVINRCDTDNLRGNWRIIPWNEHGYFMAKNWASGECLDAGAQPSEKVFTSPCDRSDSGQRWVFDCRTGHLASAGPTTVLTFWNDKKVSMRFSSGELRAKQTWDIVPRPGDCPVGG